MVSPFTMPHKQPIYNFMKTSILNGLNVNKLEFDYNIRYTPIIKVSPLAMQRQIQYLFREVEFEYIYYVWENNRFSKNSHSHSLIKTTDKDIIEKLQRTIISKREPIIGKRIENIIREREFTSLKDGATYIHKQDTPEIIDFTTIIGKHGEVHIEPIMNKFASSIYVNKFTEYGSNFGYIPYKILKDVND
jgi:hypothetical protein